MAAAVVQAAPEQGLGTEDSEALALGELDITTDAISLAGIDKEIEAFAESEVLRAILDQGAWAGGYCRADAALQWCCVLALLSLGSLGEESHRRSRCLAAWALSRALCCELLLSSISSSGGDPKAFSRQYETRLRQAELESIQDYIAESDNLLALHSQVRKGC